MSTFGGHGLRTRPSGSSLPVASGWQYPGDPSAERVPEVRGADGVRQLDRLDELGERGWTTSPG
jgi:hypothetical protein